MELHYWRGPNPNFGDDLNLWLWDHLLPNWRDHDPATTLFGVGTLINQNNFSKYASISVVGSGAGYGDIPTAQQLTSNRIWCVRGPASAKVLGLDEACGIIDPAALLPTLDIVEPCSLDCRKIFVPHHSTANFDINLEDISRRAGLTLVSPSENPISVITKIASAELVVAESLHAAIVADAFRVPWIPVSINSEFNEFKWLDWMSSVGMRVPIFHMLKMFKSINRRLFRAQVRFREIRSPQTKSAEFVEKFDYDSSNNRVKTNLEKYFSYVAPIFLRELKSASKGPAFLSEEGVVEKKQSDLISVLERIRGTWR